MKIKNLGLFVILFSFTCSQEVAAQKVVFEDVTTINGSITTTEKYAIIDCSGMPKKTVKTPDELSKSKTIGGRVRRHIQNTFQDGSEIVSAIVGDSIDCGTDGKGTNLISQKVSRKFAVAPTVQSSDGRTTWHGAAGWRIHPKNTNGIITLLVVGTADSGCAAYQGRNSSDPKGTWRLPTHRELLMIYSLHGQLETTDGFAKFEPQLYWSSTELDITAVWTTHFTTGASSARGRQVAVGDVRYRCVRDL